MVRAPGQDRSRRDRICPFHQPSERMSSVIQLWDDSASCNRLAKWNTCQIMFCVPPETMYDKGYLTFIVTHSIIIIFDKSN